MSEALPINDESGGLLSTDPLNEESEAKNDSSTLQHAEELNSGSDSDTPSEAESDIESDTEDPRNESEGVSTDIQVKTELVQEEKKSKKDKKDKKDKKSKKDKKEKKDKKDKKEKKDKKDKKDRSIKKEPLSVGYESDLTKKEYPMKTEGSDSDVGDGDEDFNEVDDDDFDLAALPFDPDSIDYSDVRIQTDDLGNLINIPSKPLAPYMLWAQTARASVVQQNPGVSVAEIGRMLGTMWRAAGRSVQQKAKHESKVMKAKYDYYISLLKEHDAKQSDNAAANAQANEDLGEEHKGPGSEASNPATSSAPLYEQFVSLSKGKKQTRVKAEPKARAQPKEKAEPKAKTKRRATASVISSGDMSRVDEVGYQDYEDEEMASVRRAGRMTETEKEQMLERGIQLGVQEFLMRMENAAEEDELANVQKKPALNKLQAVNELVAHCSNAKLQLRLVDSGVLDVLAKWLKPLPDGSLVNESVRSQVFRVCSLLPVTESQVAASGLGRALAAYFRHPQETETNKRVLHEVIQKWTRLVIASSTNFADMAKLQDQEQDAIAMLQRKRGLENQDKAPSFSSGSKRPKMPVRQGFDYAIRPSQNYSSHIIGDDEAIEAPTRSSRANDNQLVREFSELQRKRRSNSQFIKPAINGR